MMDQLASIGVGFVDGYIDLLFQENAKFYRNPPEGVHLTKKPWAIKSIYERNKPVRPFGLGKIFETYKGIHRFAGKATRTPGLYHRVEPVTGAPTRFKLTKTNERVHPSVRIRLENHGPGPNDHGRYQCPALTKMWYLSQREIDDNDPIPPDASWGAEGQPETPYTRIRWVWNYVGPEESAPDVRTMVEENLGPYQRLVFLSSV